MSHVYSNNEILITDIGAFNDACAECRVELRREKKTFTYYGGANERCDMAVTGEKARYEVGLCRARWDEQKKRNVEDAQGDGWILKYDNWNNMGGLGERVGRDCTKLLDVYLRLAATRKMRSLGWEVRQERQADGSVKLYGTPQRAAGRQQQQASW